MRFLCYFIHRHLDFRTAEVESLAALFGCDVSSLNWQKPPGTHSVDSPFYFIDLPSEAIATEITNRSVLLKGIFEIWGEGSNHEEVEAGFHGYPKERVEPFLTAEKSFKIVIDTFGHALSMDDQMKHMHRLEYIPFKGAVSLKTPDCTFWLIQSVSYEINNGLPPPTDPWMCFARQVALSDRSTVTKYQLPKRVYLGPTAMDAEMALLMANHSHCRQGSLVYDPFAGTGSVLVAAAHYGAYTMGADIDIRVVRDGKGPNRNVWANFKQYGLPAPVGLIRADNNCPPWRSDLGEILDAIVCDPPYGVRAGGRKSGGRKILNGSSEDYIIPEHLRENHIPSTAPYPLSECLFDLLDMAARLLVIHGRLVYFYPAAREEYKDDDVPLHPCLTLLSNCEQILTKRWSRRLIVMEKSSVYTEEMAMEAKEKHALFRLNHKEVLEEDRRVVRDAVFSPMGGEGNSMAKEELSLDALDGFERPRYRAKCI